RTVRLGDGVQLQDDLLELVLDSQLQHPRTLRTKLRAIGDLHRGLCWIATSDSIMLVRKEDVAELRRSSELARAWDEFGKRLVLRWDPARVETGTFAEDMVELRGRLLWIGEHGDESAVTWPVDLLLLGMRSPKDKLDLETRFPEEIWAAEVSIG